MHLISKQVGTAAAQVAGQDIRLEEVLPACRALPRLLGVEMPPQRPPRLCEQLTYAPRDR